MLDMTLKDLERVLYFENYIVIEPGLTPLKERQLLTEDEFYKAQDEYGNDSFTAEIGAEAIRKLLAADRPGEAARRAPRRDRGSPRRRKAEEAGQAPESGRSLHRFRQPPGMDDPDRSFR